MLGLLVPGWVNHPQNQAPTLGLLSLSKPSVNEYPAKTAGVNRHITWSCSVVLVHG